MAVKTVEKREYLCYTSLIECEGEGMNETIDILDIDVNSVAVKDALKEIISFVNSEAISVVDVLSSEAVILLEDKEEIKEGMKEFDLILPGDKEILLAANIEDNKLLEDTKKQLLIKLAFQYFHRNKTRVFLLTDTTEKSDMLCKRILKNYPNLSLMGMAKVSGEDRADDMLVNAINGAEVEVVLSMLPTPFEEEFVIKNKNVINARLFMGMGSEIAFLGAGESRFSKISQFVKKKIIKKEIQKRKAML